VGSLLHRATAKHFNEPTGEQMLQLMTLDGARVLGMENEIGSLEVGKQADVVAIDLSAMHNAPLHNPVTAILFSAAASDVLFTMVAGRVLYADGEIKGLDEKQLNAQLSKVLQKIVD
jgi:5-methylthioadenosine/S-adenosylhomocysteine deaminase